MAKFDNYQWNESTLQFIKRLGFTKMTPIQEVVFKNALKGKDIIGIAATGTGKSHAFLIPLCNNIDVDKDEVQAVITAPTRELAMQLYHQALIFNKDQKAFRVHLISGGLEKSKMNTKLKQQPHMIIGTPGRIKDLFLNEKTLRLEMAKTLVIDEADMTFTLGFLDDIDAIAGHMRKDLQIMSFSATLPLQLQQFLKKYMHQPFTYQADTESDFKPQIEHILVPCYAKSYAQKLLEILPSFQPYVCLIFANTRKDAASVAKYLRESGYKVLEMHGDLTSRERTKAIKQLQNMEQTYVVASDIAARGMDVEGVSHVVSLGFPTEIAYYVHRSGRTGRSGRSGTCFALYQKKDDEKIKSLEKQGIHFEHRDLKKSGWVDLSPLHAIKKWNEKQLTKDIVKKLGKKKKVKPNYKVKHKAEVDMLQRRARREMIKNDITRQKKERAKTKSIEERGKI